MNRTAARSSNGFQNKPLANLKAVVIGPPALAKPKSYATALEKCRRALGWSQQQLLAEVFRGTTSVNISDIKRWETARSTPTATQAQKLRAAIPALAAFDDLLPLEARAFGKPAPGLPAPVSPAGWAGPPVPGFQEALRYVRRQNGMTTADVGRLVGVTRSGANQWETVSKRPRMVRQNYDKLCEIFPQLKYAPKPEFSTAFKNTIKKKGFLEGDEARIETVRAVRELEAIAAPAPTPPIIREMAAALKQPDHAKLNELSASAGVARGRVLALRAEKAGLKRRQEEEIRQLMERHEEEEKRMEEQIARSESEAQGFEAQAEAEASRMYGGDK